MPSCFISWRCDGTYYKNDKKRNNTLELVSWVLSRHANRSVRCNIRQGPHPDTYDPYRRPVSDPKGNHITAEFLDPTDNMWYNFHLYVIKEKGKWVMKPDQNPNPTYTDNPFTTEQSHPRIVDPLTGKLQGREEYHWYTPIQDVIVPVEAAPQT